MIRFGADECLNNVILRGLRRRKPDVDVVRVQDVTLDARDDQAVLAWAAREERVMLTNDQSTMPMHAYERVRQGERMPGLFVIPRDVPVGAVVDDLVIIAECSREDEWENQVVYLPLTK